MLSRDEPEEMELIVVDDRRDEEDLVEDRLVGWSAGHAEEVQVRLAQDGATYLWGDNAEAA